jgi:hypothetical protein
MDDLEVGEDFGDFLTALVDLREDVLSEAPIDEAARFEEFDDLVVVHVAGNDGGGKVREMG